MLMTNSTPGPWYNDKGHRIHVLARVKRPGENEAQICSMFNSDFVDPAEQRANARLIAAAPDLLEIVSLLGDWIEQGGESVNFGTMTDDSTTLRQAVKAAMAKATGKIFG